MKASAIEFRLRFVIVVILGFWSPWVEAWGIGHPFSMLECLPLELSRLGMTNFSAASAAVIVLGAVAAGIGAALRIWGTAYLGYDTVKHGDMQAGAVMADGPYRHVRNPLYLGTWFMIAAMSLIMPPTGALFTMVLITVFLLRLILGEEAFLAGQLGESYAEYRRMVPRLIPRLRASLPASGNEPHWLTAVIAEVNPIGVFLTLAVVSWSYDHRLMLRAILISLGVSLVVRALMPRGEVNADPA